MTMKFGDETKIMDNIDEMNPNQDFQYLQLAKNQINTIANKVETENPEMKGKRIEIIMEYDDGFYIVVGRKSKEVTEFDT